MSYFVKAVDRRSRKAMISFLENHERYNTLNSNNRSTSYAHCIKFHRLGLTSEQVDAAYKLLGVEDYWDHIDEPIANFTRAMHGDYTIGTNGRSGGIWSCTTPDTSRPNTSRGVRRVVNATSSGLQDRWKARRPSSAPKSSGAIQHGSTRCILVSRPFRLSRSQTTKS